MYATGRYLEGAGAGNQGADVDEAGVSGAARAGRRFRPVTAASDPEGRRPEDVPDASHASLLSSPEREGALDAIATRSFRSSIPGRTDGEPKTNNPPAKPGVSEREPLEGAELGAAHERLHRGLSKASLRSLLQLCGGHAASSLRTEPLKIIP